MFVTNINSVAQLFRTTQQRSACDRFLIIHHYITSTKHYCVLKLDANGLFVAGHVMRRVTR